MKTGLVTVRPDDSAAAAAKKMAEHGVGFLPVVDGKQPLGVITDRDIVLRVVAKDASIRTPVSEFMSTDVAYVSITDPFETLAALMSERKKSRLLVCNQRGELVGVVSLSDLPRANADRARDVLVEVSEREAHPPSL